MAIGLETIVVGIALFAAIALVMYLLLKNREWKAKFDQRVRDFLELHEESIRKDAISRSARTLSGKTLEKLIPFLERFDHNPHDVRWLGDPIDLVVFDGYSDSDHKDIDKITFVEVKSGDSDLHGGQKRIRDVVEKKKVSWEEFRVE